MSGGRRCPASCGCKATPPTLCRACHYRLDPAARIGLAGEPDHYRFHPWCEEPAASWLATYRRRTAADRLAGDT